MMLVYQQLSVALCSGGCGRKTTKQRPSLRHDLDRACRCGYVGNVLRFGLEIMRSEKAGMIRHDRGFEI